MVFSRGGQCCSQTSEQMDVGLTDPDTRVGLLQAQACNMRSKCRCSCVLQFTLCHAFSCVLHRPPSQLIRCIVLYVLVVQTKPNSIQRKNQPLHDKAFPGGGTKAAAGSPPQIAEQASQLGRPRADEPTGSKACAAKHTTRHTPKRFSVLKTKTL